MKLSRTHAVLQAEIASFQSSFVNQKSFQIMKFAPICLIVHFAIVDIVEIWPTWIISNKVFNLNFGQLAFNWYP